MKIKSIKIIKVPSFAHLYDKDRGIKNKCIPFLGSGIISSYLRSKGIDIEQDDLDIKVHHDNLYYPEKYISGGILNRS